MTSLEPDLGQARAFLELLDPGTSQFTFQCFDDSSPKSRSLSKVWHGSLEDLAEPLAALQRAGAGVFVTVNRTALKGRRTAENIVAVRACFVDLDGASPDPVIAGALPPHIVVESSPGRFHAYWRVQDLPLDRFTPLQKAIASRFAGDKSVHDLPRVMRLPGFWHLKGTPFQTRCVPAAPPDEPYSAEQLLAGFRSDTEASGDVSGTADYEELAELIRQVMTAESFHEPLVRLAWRFLRGSMPAGRVVETLQGMLLAVPEPHDARWQARFDEIERTVESAVAKQGTPRSWEIILVWAAEKYRLCLIARDGRIVSEALGRPIRVSDLEIDPDIINRLTKAADAPRLKGGGVNWNRLVSQFKTWREVAWGELKRRLPQEGENDVASLLVKEELEVLLTNLLACPLTIHYGGMHTASLGSLARTFAELTTERWQRVVDLPLWGKAASDKLWVGLGPELAARMRSCPDIAAMTPAKLNRICKRHGLSDPEITHVYDTEGGPQRATILCPEFVATLELVNLMYDPKAAALQAWFTDALSRAKAAH